MKRRMLAVEIYLNDSGHVCISQEDPADEPSIVVLEPAQVPTVIKWLQECVEEIGQGEST